MARLVLVHGRSQHGKDALTLKNEWIAILKNGFAKSNLDFPIPETEVKFPYYGQALRDLVQGMDPSEAATVVIKGAEESDEEELEWLDSVLGSVVKALDISDDEVAAMSNDRVIQKDLLNGRYARAMMELIDRKVGIGSALTVALATKDVHKYLSNPGTQDTIETGLMEAMDGGSQKEPVVVVGHSLGSVISYRVLRREGTRRDWHVPLFVTIGSPLAVTRIKKALARNEHPACVEKWFNARDHQDYVALYPLDKVNFPIEPEIENKSDVQNQTSNHHGISGYLNDKEVALRIYEALSS
jgi:hypothetical protein